MNRKKELPYCFGKMEKVFPLCEDGLRHTPEHCMPCICKTECLRAAMTKPEGVTVLEEKVDRAYGAGVIGFLERWSRKKVLDRRRKDRENAG